MIVCLSKCKIFKALYQSKSWMEVTDLLNLGVDIKIIQRNLREMTDDGVVIRAKTRPAFRYTVEKGEKSHLEMIKYCEIYDIFLEKEPACG